MPAKAKCVTIRDTADFCGAGKAFDTSKETTDCAGTACTKEADVGTCCKHSGVCGECTDPEHNCKCPEEKTDRGDCGGPPGCYKTNEEQCLKDGDIWCATGAGGGGGGGGGDDGNSEYGDCVGKSCADAKCGDVQWPEGWPNGPSSIAFGR